MNEHEIFMIKARDYLNKIIEINRNVNEMDEFTFFDHKSMYYWKRGNDSKLVKEYRENLIPSEERLEEIMLYAKIYDELYKSKRIIIDIYENKISEYFVKISELQRNIDEFDDIRFFDNTDMFEWYTREQYKLLEERKNDIIPTKERMEEIMLFSYLEKFIIEIDNKNYNRYVKRVNEYLIQVKKLGRNIKTSDNIYFSDGKNMYEWYENEVSKIKFEVLNKKNYSETKMHQIMLFAKIENLLYDIKINNLKKLKKEVLKLRNPSKEDPYCYIYEDPLVKYKRRCEEYYELIVDLGMNLNKYDEEYFSDGTKMFRWYEREYKKYREENESNVELTEIRKIERKLFSKIVEKVKEYKRSRLLVKYKRRCEEYYELIVDLGMNLNEYNEEYFSDGTKMFRWYEREYRKYRKENKSNVELTEIRKIERKLFSKIVEKVKEYRRSKLLVKQKSK